MATRGRLRSVQAGEADDTRHRTLGRLDRLFERHENKHAECHERPRHVRRHEKVAEGGDASKRGLEAEQIRLVQNSWGPVFNNFLGFNICF